MNVKLNEKCSCGGTFKEMSLYDNWDGTLTCDKCKQTKPDVRYVKIKHGSVR